MSGRTSGTVTATATRKAQGQKPVEVEHSESIPPLEYSKEDGQTVLGPLSEVEVGMGHTANLGNFNSLRVDVRVRIPVMRGEEEEGIKYAEKIADLHAERIVKENKF